MHSIIVLWIISIFLRASPERLHPWLAAQQLQYCFFTILVWAVSGPVFGFSDTWQLVVNTGTTIITFLMVFLTQNTQNRDSHAMQIKLDELIRVTKGAHNVLLDLEELNEKELREICLHYEEIAKKSRRLLKEGRSDTSIAEVVLRSSDKSKIKP